MAEISTATEVTTKADFDASEFLLWKSDNTPLRISAENLRAFTGLQLLKKYTTVITLTAAFQDSTIDLDTSDLTSTSTVLFKIVFQDSAQGFYSVDVPASALESLTDIGSSNAVASGNNIEIFGTSGAAANKGITIGLKGGDLWVARLSGTSGRITNLHSIAVYRY